MFNCNIPFVSLLVTLVTSAYCQTDFTFRIEPGQPGIQLVPDTRVLFASTDNFLLVEPGAGTQIIDTILSGATFHARDGYMVLRPMQDQREVTFSLLTRVGDRGKPQKITRTFRVIPLPEVSLARVPCDSATSAMGLLAPGKLSVNVKSTDVVFTIDSFKVDVPGLYGNRTFEMKKNHFSTDFRKAAIDLPGGSLVMFYDIYGSWIKGIPIQLPGCNIYMLEEVYPEKFSVGDDD
jgi:hypothetical protein